MKLSDAIRLGAMLKPQSFYGPNTNRVPLTYLPDACALAAACLAEGIEYLNVFGPQFESRWGYLHRVSAACPVDGCSDFTEMHVGRLHVDAIGVVAHLNDRHRWTREQIADWVATIEAQQQEAPVQIDQVPA